MRNTSIQKSWYSKNIKMKTKGTIFSILEWVWGLIKKLDPNKTYICYIAEKETKEMRSLWQNNFFWGLFTEIWKYMWEDKETVRTIFMWIAFWLREYKLNNWKSINIPKKAHTADLEKTEAIYLIDLLWKFIEDKNIPCKYTPKEIQSLYDSLKDN